MKYVLKEGERECTIILCSLNKPTDKPEDALKILKLLPKNQTDTLIIPADARFGTTEFQQYVHQYNINRIISIGSNRNVFRKFDVEQRQHFSTPDAFLDGFRREDFGKENILIYDEVEPLSYLLEKKNRQTILEVNLDAIASNIRYFQSKLKPGVKLAALVKAFSYGTSAYEVASLMQHMGVDYLGVAASDEGIQLRESGITLPIIVLTPETENLYMMIKYKLEPELHNFRSLANFIEAANHFALTAYPVHIKIDSGMHRQGFEEHELGKLVDLLNKNSCVKVVSCFTHLAASDEEQHDDFTRQQLAVFDRSSRQLQDGLGYSVIRHALNSSGIERFPEGQFDMTRLGIGMYGGSEVSAHSTQVVSTMRSVITQVKDIAPDDTVGYGRRGKVTRPTRIGVVPVGYADGFHRRHSNGNGYFLVNGQPAPIIGNICMDLTMIDITDVGAKEGDEVVIFGEKPSAFELAEQLGTISYEVLSGITSRVKRVYILTDEVIK